MIFDITHTSLLGVTVSHSYWHETAFANPAGKRGQPELAAIPRGFAQFHVILVPYLTQSRCHANGDEIARDARQHLPRRGSAG